MVRGRADELDDDAVEETDEFDDTEDAGRGRRRRGTAPSDQAVRRAAVILDVDGTLVDSNDAHARAWVAAFADDGITVAYDAVRRAIGMGGDKLMPVVAGIEEDSPEGRRDREAPRRDLHED